MHVHIILTGGGLSLEKEPEQQRWIEFPKGHVASAGAVAPLPAAQEQQEQQE